MSRLRQPEITGRPSPGRSPRRFLAIFVPCFLFGFALVITPAVKPWIVKFSGALVKTSATLITACGGKARIEGDNGTILREPRSGYGVEMKDGCNGVNVTILLWAALIAFPASRIQKAKGLLLGGLAIQAMNEVRFVSLYYLLQYDRSLFDFAHEYLWESLIILDAFVVFWFWAQRVCRSAAMLSAAV